MNLGTGKYFIRKQIGQGWDFEVFGYDKCGDKTMGPVGTVDMAEYRTLERAVAEWASMPALFQVKHAAAYIVGPRVGYYTTLGKRIP